MERVCIDDLRLLVLALAGASMSLTFFFIYILILADKILLQFQCRSCPLLCFPSSKTGQDSLTLTRAHSYSTWKTLALKAFCQIAFYQIVLSLSQRGFHPVPKTCG